MQPLMPKPTATLFLVVVTFLSEAEHIACHRTPHSSGSVLSDFPEAQSLKHVKKQPLSVLHHNVEVAQQPAQGLHVALAGPDNLRATWMTPVSPGLGPFKPVCYYGVKDVAVHKVQGRSYSYSAGKFNQTLNTAILDLSTIACQTNSSSTPCIKTFSYRCGDQTYGFSDAYQVHFHKDTAVPLVPGPQFAVVGDLGVPHGQNTIDSIAARLEHGSTAGVQMLLHVGDISYADFFDKKSLNNSWVWVDYMNSLQKVAGQVPYMTAPGNHEAQFDFAAYLNWLPMPHSASDSGSPFWFSFDYLGVHVVMYSTEHDFSPNSTQHRWIQQDLKQADENRAHVPWVVVMGHRPLYCSSLVEYERCHKEASVYRDYLEDLFYESRVDVVIAGHIHQYERSYPVYRGSATQRHYLNPRAPVYIVNGAAGNPELNDPTFEPNVPWRAWYDVTIQNGFLLMTPSRSQLTFQYILSGHSNITDSFTISKK